MKLLSLWGIHSSDLKRIRETVKAGALREFVVRKSRKPMVSASEVERLEREKTRLEQAYQTSAKGRGQRKHVRDSSWRGWGGDLCPLTFNAAQRSPRTSQRLEAQMVFSDGLLETNIIRYKKNGVKT